MIKNLKRGESFLKENLKTIAQNKKAFHDYFLEESFEAGIELCGTEVKSIRQGRVNLKDRPPGRPSGISRER